MRRSPEEVENTWVSPGRGTTCSVVPFSGTARPPTRTTRSLRLAADLGGAVDVAVGAELLDDVHGDGEAGRGGLGVLGEGLGRLAVVLDDVEVLGADADRDGACRPCRRRP